MGEYLEAVNSGDEDRWEDEGQIDDAEGEESFGKTQTRGKGKGKVGSDEDSEEDGDMGEEEEDSDEAGKRKKKVSGLVLLSFPFELTGTSHEFSGYMNFWLTRSGL